MTIRKSKVTLILNKPVSVWMGILDLIKVLMYEFYYNYIKNRHGNNLKLLLTNTGSVTHEIKTEDLNDYFSNDKEMTDFRNK